MGRPTWKQAQARRGIKALWLFRGFLERINWPAADRDRVCALYARGELSWTLEQRFRRELRP